MVKKKQTPGASTELKPVSAVEALKKRREDLVVPASKEIELSPEGEYARHCQIIEMKTFKDLQRMSLVPEGLDEKVAMEAIARDRDAAFEAAQRAPWRDDSACDCHDDKDGKHAATRSKTAYSTALRARYNDVRRNVNAHLARALSDVYRRDVGWDHLVAAHAARWVDQLVVSDAILFPVYWLQDVTVNNNSTLTIAPNTQMLWAKKIRIHVGGKITKMGSYMKIKCASIEGNLA